MLYPLISNSFELRTAFTDRPENRTIKHRRAHPHITWGVFWRLRYSIKYIVIYEQLFQHKYNLFLLFAAAPECVREGIAY